MHMPFDHMPFRSREQPPPPQQQPDEQQQHQQQQDQRAPSPTSSLLHLPFKKMSPAQVKPPAKTRAVARKGERTFIEDQSNPYPLPVDLSETHRQSLSTLLLFQLYNGPVINPVLDRNPPKRVLEVGCGSGFWSTMCYQHFADRGHTDITFVGVDIVNDNSFKPEAMNWQFHQTDLRQRPWRLLHDHFDLVVVKEMSLAFDSMAWVPIFEEAIRVLKPGGVLETWDRDCTVRSLRAQDVQDNELGVYDIGRDNHPTTFALGVANGTLKEYNAWLTEALEERGVSPEPCTQIGSYFAQESDKLTGVISKRIAVPLSSRVRWERGRTLNPSQVAIRRTALESTTGLIRAFEHVLRSVNNMDDYDWGKWSDKAMKDLTNPDNLSSGECMEVGVWSATKRQ